jgi:flagellar FliJ protein
VLKYKYKLEALLKLKKFKESTLKVELGKINQEIASVIDSIKNLKGNIEQSYQEQEVVLSEATSGQMAQFYPLYIQGQREDIKNKEALLYSLRKKYENKLQEVSLAMGETKLIAKMKEDDFKKYKHKLEKKEHEKREEMYIMRHNLKES